MCRQSGHLNRVCPLSGLCRRCKQPGHVARECGRAWGQPRPPSSVPAPSDPNPDPFSTPSDPVPVTHPVPDDRSPVPGSEDDKDLSCNSSDRPDPASVPSYQSITLDDLPRILRIKHVKRISAQATAFPSFAPKVPVTPKSAAVPF